MDQGKLKILDSYWSYVGVKGRSNSFSSVPDFLNFTLANARRFYSSRGDLSDRKSLNVLTEKALTKSKSKPEQRVKRMLILLSEAE